MASGSNDLPRRTLIIPLSTVGWRDIQGRPDGGVTREEALERAREISAATPLPVSAEFQNGFGDAPEPAAATVALASRTGLADCSIEDCGLEQGSRRADS